MLKPSPKYLLFPAALVILAGCSDEMTSPVVRSPMEANRAQAPALQGPLQEFDRAPRFDLDLEIGGALRPGQPIQLILRGRAHFSTVDAEIRLMLPEVVAAEQSSWEVVEMPAPGEPIPPYRQWRRPLAAGEAFQERVTVTIPEPGYYAVLASVIQHSSDPLPNGQLATDAAQVAVWLWIDEKGGRITDDFDRTIFPVGTRPEPGPLGLIKDPPRMRRGSQIGLQCHGCAEYNNVVSVEYTDEMTGGRNRLEGALLRYIITHVATGSQRSGEIYTAIGGPTYITCGTMDPNAETIEITAYSSNQAIDVAYFNEPPILNNRKIVGTFSGPCSHQHTMIVRAKPSHLFTNLRLTVEESDRTFANRVHRVIASIDDLRRTGYYYNGDIEIHEAHINITASNIWLRWGVFVAAHEWGHMFHDKDLGGMIRYYNGCPVNHPPENKTTLECALAEGFADYYAVATRGSATGKWESDIQSNYYYSISATTDGSVVQGAVAAFLYDMTDPRNDEGWDLVEMSKKDFADLIRSCQVRYNDPNRGLTWTYNRGTDHLVYCLERRQPYRIHVNGLIQTFFTTRNSKADSYSHFAYVSPAPDDIRRLWLVNLYERHSTVGLNPSFSSEPSEGPGDPTEPEDPVYGGCDDPTQIVCTT